jgi:putative membrane protein
VLFGVYQPMMELFAHPFQTWKKHLKWIIPFMIGVAIGFFVTALGLEAFFERHERIATCTFLGLILGTIPDLFREGGKQGRSRTSWCVFGVATAVLLTFFIGVNFLHTELSMNFFWSFFCGILWGVSIIVPGMSSSAILINIGLYQEMNSAIAVFDLKVLIPMGIGMVLLIVLCSHLVNLLFEKHYAIAFSVVIAAVLSSTVASIPITYSGVGELILDVAIMVVSTVAAYFLTKFMNRLAPQEEAPQKEALQEE